MPLLVDTGVLYALADSDDAWHERCRAFLVSQRETLLAPVTVLPEVAYLLNERLGASAERALVASLAAGELQVENLTFPDIRRARAILDRYHDIGFVDASVMAIAERLNLRRIATTDRRHFAQVRPKHAPSFELVP